MKAEDLRIGSYYHSVKFNTHVTLTAEDIHELVIRAEGASIDHYIDEMFKPITLTEEWLLKFGFKKDVELYYTKGRWSFLWNVRFNCWDGFYAQHNGGMNLPTIQYVHRFQNLYYEFEGE